jgi:hypothetical protein
MDAQNEKRVKIKIWNPLQIPLATGTPKKVELLEKKMFSS